MVWLAALPDLDGLIVIVFNSCCYHFPVFIILAELKAAGVFTDPKSIIMATFILCGFANFSSIGIQIGGIGALAPRRWVLLSKLGVHAVIGGTLASLMSATIIGMIMG